MKDTDRVWEEYGSDNPYYGVLTDPLYLGRSLDDSTRERFFATGERHVADMFARLQRTVDPDFSPAEAMDFGCGVGRVTLPLAARCQRVVGVDISPSMLAEAEANAERFRVRNVDFVLSDDALSRVPGMFDLIHTTIVLQHIPTRRGYSILAVLLERLKPGGVGVVHVTFGSTHSRRQTFLRHVRAKVPGARAVLNVVRGRTARSPIMQMNSYDLGRVFGLIQQAGGQECLLEFTDHAGFLGTTIFFRRD